MSKEKQPANEKHGAGQHHGGKTQVKTPEVEGGGPKVGYDVEGGGPKIGYDVEPGGPKIGYSAEVGKKK